jgi:predicted ribonuclease YlaK
MGASSGVDPSGSWTVSYATASMPAASAAAGKIVIANTNVFMEHRFQFEDIDWAAIIHARADPVLLVIPLVVVDELDKNKRNNERWRAAYSQSRLNSILRAFGTNDGVSVSIRDADWSSDDAKGERGPRGEVRLRVLFDPPEHERLARATDEIGAVTIQAYTGRDTQLVTFDTGMALRARRAGLIVHQLGDQDRLEKPAKGRGRSAQAPSAEANTAGL